MAFDGGPVSVPKPDATYGCENQEDLSTMIFIVPVNFLVDDTCNPLPGFIPTYKTVGYEQSAGCRLYPEVYEELCCLIVSEAQCALMLICFG
jgi:hypothetical protein